MQRPSPIPILALAPAATAAAQSEDPVPADGPFLALELAGLTEGFEALLDGLAKARDESVRGRARKGHRSGL